MKFKYITSIGVLSIIGFFSLSSLVLKDREKSELEGRTLQKFPTLQSKSLLNGKTFKDLDKYFSDHIALRDTMVNSYIKSQNVLDKKNINGVYIGSDGYLFSEETITPHSKTDIEKSAKYFDNFFKDIDSKVYLMPLPHKIMMYEDKMPIEGYKTRGNEYFKIFKDSINSSEKLELLDYTKAPLSGDLYYKTDHHWNSNGSYIGYKYIMETLKKDFKNLEDPLPLEQFSKKEFKNIFLGSDGRKVSSIQNNLDSIELYLNPKLKNCILYQNNKKINFIFEESISDNKLNNDYLIYLKGDRDKLVSKNSAATNNLKIALIGDSMDNILLPFLAPHFKEIYSYDLRKFKGNIKNELEEIKPDIILNIALLNNFILADKGAVFKLQR